MVIRVGFDTVEQPSTSGNADRECEGAIVILPFSEEMYHIRVVLRDCFCELQEHRRVAPSSSIFSVIPTVTTPSARSTNPCYVSERCALEAMTRQMRRPQAHILCARRAGR